MKTVEYGNSVPCAEGPLELLELCKGRAMALEERRVKAMLALFRGGYYVDPGFVNGTEA